MMISYTEWYEREFFISYAYKARKRPFDANTVFNSPLRGTANFASIYDIQKDVFRPISITRPLK